MGQFDATCDVVLCIFVLCFCFGVGWVRFCCVVFGCVPLCCVAVCCVVFLCVALRCAV